MQDESRKATRFFVIIGVILTAATTFYALPPRVYDLFASNNPPDYTYNPLDQIKGTKYFYRHANRFVGSRSALDTLDIMQRIEAEERAEPQRQAMLGNLIATDLIFLGFLLVVWLSPKIFQRRHVAGDAAISGAAQLLVIYRAIREKLQNLSQMVRERADRPPHI